MRTDIQIFVEEHTIVFCVLCNKSMLKKHALYKLTTYGLGVPLCKSCYDTEFKPFSTNNDDPVFGRGKERG